MKKNGVKRGTAVVLCGAMTALCACSSIPMDAEKYPEVNTTIGTENEGKFIINFYYQNNENTQCIYNSGDVSVFFDTLQDSFQQYSYGSSSLYTLNYADDKYQIVKTDYSIDGWDDARKSDDFYVTDDAISMEDRVDGGIMKLLSEEIEDQKITDNSNNNDTDTSTPEKKDDEKPEEKEPHVDAAEEAADAGDNVELMKDDASEETDAEEASKGKSVFDPNAVSVIFTDLSEVSIGDIGREIQENYLSDTRYSACVMAIKMDTEDDAPLYIADKSKDTALNERKAKGSRWYYLLMLGPAADMATYASNLNTLLKGGSGSFSDQNYHMSQLYFTPENFDNQDDLSIQTLDAGNAEQNDILEKEGENGLFESALVRLTPVTDKKESVFSASNILRDEILEYCYTKKESQYHLKGYDDTSTKDYALNMDMLKVPAKMDNVSGDTELSYAFGEPTIYCVEDGEWTEMDLEHQERFFHEIYVSDEEGNAAEYGKRLTLIGDNSDECGIHEIYLTVPVLQHAVISNLITRDPGDPISWVLNECAYGESVTDSAQEVQCTACFDKFYLNLFDLKMDGERDKNGNEYPKMKDVYTQVDTVNILLEDLH